MQFKFLCLCTFLLNQKPFWNFQISKIKDVISFFKIYLFFNWRIIAFTEFCCFLSNIHKKISFLFFSFIFICWRLITLQYCRGFCHTLTWISHGVTCIPHPDPPSHLPLHPIPLGLPSAAGLSTCLMHPTWSGDMFHPR